MEVESKNITRKSFGIALSALAVAVRIFVLIMIILNAIAVYWTINNSFIGYIDIANNVLLLMAGVYALYIFAEFMTKKAQIYRNIQVDSKNRSGWLVKEHSAGILLLVGIGFANALYVVHFTPMKMEHIDRQLIEERLTKRPYNDGSPVITYYFDLSGSTFGSINRGASKSGVWYEHAKRDNFEYYVRNASEDYLSAQRAADIRQVDVVGYADESGDTSMNINLAWRRAETVSNMLIKAGVPESVISVRSGGVKLTGCLNHEGDMMYNCLSHMRVVEVYMRGNLRNED